MKFTKDMLCKILHVHSVRDTPAINFQICKRYTTQVPMQHMPHAWFQRGLTNTSVNISNVCGKHNVHLVRLNTAPSRGWWYCDDYYPTLLLQFPKSVGEGGGASAPSSVSATLAIIQLANSYMIPTHLNWCCKFTVHSLTVSSHRNFTQASGTNHLCG